MLEYILGGYILHSIFCHSNDPKINYYIQLPEYNPWLQNLDEQQKPLTSEQSKMLDTLFGRYNV